MSLLWWFFWDSIILPLCYPSPSSSSHWSFSTAASSKGVTRASSSNLMSFYPSFSLSSILDALRFSSEVAEQLATAAIGLSTSTSSSRFGLGWSSAVAAVALLLLFWWCSMLCWLWLLLLCTFLRCFLAALLARLPPLRLADSCESLISSICLAPSGYFSPGKIYFVMKAWVKLLLYHWSLCTPFC